MHSVEKLDIVMEIDEVIDNQSFKSANENMYNQQENARTLSQSIF